ncbi:MAG: hypothetical protein CV081_00950 [Nitrospira sp. LK265]|nr:hypothetical protein [Nitrospira sp. LK265]
MLLKGLSVCVATLEGVERHAPTDQNDDRQWRQVERTYVAPCVATTSRQRPDPQIRDIPTSAQVVNPNRIDDQRAVTVGVALRKSSGIQVSGRR